LSVKLAAKRTRDDGLVAFFMLAFVATLGMGATAAFPFSILACVLIGALGVAALFQARVCHKPPLSPLGLAALTLGLFAAMRDDGLTLWQVPAHWPDLLRVTPIGLATITTVYFLATMVVVVNKQRLLSWRETLTLLATPVLFNLLLALGSVSLMGGIGEVLSLHLVTPPVAVTLGRFAALFVFVEAVTSFIALMIAGRVPRLAKLHGLLAAATALAALTPIIADLPQAFATFGEAVTFIICVAAATLAQAGLWSLTFLVTGMVMDGLRGTPPTFTSIYLHARNGFLKGAIYGGVFIFLILTAAAIITIPHLLAFVWRWPLLSTVTCGAVLFPLIVTLVGSADGTPPFFGRLKANYKNAPLYARGAVAGLGVALFLTHGLVAADGSTRFLAAFIIGALCYGGVDLAGSLTNLWLGRSKLLPNWRALLMGIGLGGLIAGMLGWYFDAPQIAVVTAKFWAYADPAYALHQRPVSAYMVYPWFSKWGALDLGQTGGGVRLFFNESLSGVINWSIAAPLFGINYFVLEAGFQRSLAPLKRLASAEGFTSLVEQTVRVLRWGLWMAPIINSFLRQSPDPAWYNQDGAIRTGAATLANVTGTEAEFKAWSLSIFTGLLAYDWLRILIWFDHMGLRVATLVNLTFVGGDRADEAAARFAGYSARTRFIPEAIRRFATWTPLLIPFYIPRGPDWDTAWSGAERLRAAHGALPLPVLQLTAAYALIGVAAGLGASFIAERWRRTRPLPMKPLPFVPAAMETQSSFELSNGCMRLMLQQDGRGHISIEGIARGGQSVDMTPQLIDPLQLRGPFIYLQEADALWSLGFEPLQKASGDYLIAQPAPDRITISNTVNGIAMQAEVSLLPDQPVALWRVTLNETSGRARRVRLSTYRPLVLHEPGSYVRDPDFNAMHVQSWFLKPLQAIFARNRLLHDKAIGRMSAEIFFHAAALQGNGTLAGYEDSRTRFIGDGTLRDPDGLHDCALRKLEDEGSLYTFDPAASLTFDIALDADGACELLILDGHAANEMQASTCIAQHLALLAPSQDELNTSLAKTRSIDMPRAASVTPWAFHFSDDGQTLHLTPKTPRPWAHLLANRQGFGTVISNEGEIHSFWGNERQNALTPYNFESVATSVPGQVIYVIDLETGEMDTAGFVPFRNESMTYDVAYGFGFVQFKASKQDLDLELTIFVPPEEPADIRILTVHNKAGRQKRFRIVPYFEMILGENTLETRGRLKVEEDKASGALLYNNPRNDFRAGWAFAATSLKDARTETMRPHFIGGAGRDLANPVMAETGMHDASVPSDGRRVAAFAQEIDIPAHGQAEIAVVLGEAATREEALTLARRLASVKTAKRLLASTKADWANRFKAIRVTTNKPEFDRLVNHWLPYQLLTSRLWGRTGPNQRGGAFGFRDQLQDVLPLVFFEPALTRRQIVLHAGQQFPEGDVFKWWHQAPDGKTGIGQRTRASDPHLWLPYVTIRYVAATGDESVLDDVVPYLQGPAIPPGVIDLVFAALPSNETCTVYDHCRRAISYALSHLGPKGLPQIGTGDWNDSIDAAGLQGRGESVWLGFFLHDVIAGFIPLAEAKEGEDAASFYRATLQRLKEALDSVWQGERYPLAFNDDGRAFDVASAMTAAWPALSGATDLQRGLAALETPLLALEKADRILLVTPPFDEHSDPFPGRVTDYPPGVRENGGQYSHGVSWVVDAYMKLAALAAAEGKTELAERLRARAFTCWAKISPIGKTEGEALAVYGLPPHQQPADIYDSPGYAGRGGWSWYTGSAARMLSAAYLILGLEMKDGEIAVPANLFEPKGDLEVMSVEIEGRKITREDVNT